MYSKKEIKIKIKRYTVYTNQLKSIKGENQNVKYLKVKKLK